MAAFRRSLALKSRLFAQQQRLAPSFSYIHHEEDRKNQYSNEDSIQSRSYSRAPLGFGGGGLRDPRWNRFVSVPMTTSGFLLARNMSTAIGGGSGGAEKIEYMTDMADMLSDKTMEAVSTQAPAVSEIAVAVADSWPPVAALQYVIDGVHTFTGMNWWTSIVITTLIIRTLSIPIMVNQLKATSKLTILRPELERIKQEMEDRGMSPSAVAEGQAKMESVFKQHGVSTFTPLKGLLIQGPVFVSFFLAIQNMVEKVPSFKTGGMSWFLDLTTADSFYILPCLTAFSFWITVEFNMQEGMQGNPAGRTMKNVSRAFAALTVPLTLSFPKALFCYWITSNVFSLVYGLRTESMAAFRRSLALKSRLFAQQQRLAPSFSYIHHEEDRKNQYSNEDSIQSRSYSRAPLGFGGGGLRDPRWNQFVGVPMTTSGFLLARNMSTAIGGGSGGAEKIEYMTDMADMLSDKTMEAVSTQAPAVSEIAVAVADSWPPVAALQYVIDGVHTFTGMNWWTSIVITTLIIRTLSIPIMVNQLKATSKLTILRPELERIKQEMQDRGMSPSAVAEGQAKMKSVFKQHGVSTFTPLKGLFIQGPVFVSFFLAIQNMVEKVPSFKTGGMSWFLDLTTADSFYILPVLTAFSFWITVEFNMQDGMQGNPAGRTMKNVSRAFAALTVPLTLSFPKALFCYWITSNIFSLVYGLIIKRPNVKKLLNIPIIVPPPQSPTSQSQPEFSFLQGLKKFAAAQAMQQREAKSGPTSQSTTSAPLLSHNKPSSEEQKSSNKKVSSSSVLSHRIKNLEKEVKGRKKNKRR
ncbi:hypothetical protein OSB04_022259 [Centaurea solstitialis]|uniref:Membrane insertase YidC/Oxa/ALB C-terminal domain-containing protein n=1 Tax=Centaurea solstitialis TaxID=347529 RepID=A0AA38T722_9ASTR|nr:hypothetical protein OSB04_022259 [Centaurea solstitialis]